MLNGRSKNMQVTNQVRQLAWKDLSKSLKHMPFVNSKCAKEISSWWSLCSILVPKRSDIRCAGMSYR